MNCSNCGADLGGPRSAEAGIAVLVNGNEVIHSYFRCVSCGLWTVEHYEDQFMSGETSIWTSGPLSDEVGRRCANLVNVCPDPQDKHCSCASHKQLYHGVPAAS